MPVEFSREQRGGQKARVFATKGTRINTQTGPYECGGGGIRISGRGQEGTPAHIRGSESCEKSKACMTGNLKGLREREIRVLAEGV